MAGSLNKVMLIGRLGADPQLKYLPSGQPVVNVNLATDESFKDRNTGDRTERTEWHRLVIYGKTAELAANYLTKGRLIFVEGKLRTRKWQGQDGQDRYTTEVVADRVDFLDSKGGGARDGEYGGYQGAGQGSGGGQGGYGGRQQGKPQGGRREDHGPQGSQGYDDDDLGPAFPSEAGGMDDVPF